MGLFDFIFAPFQQAGQQTIQNVTGQITTSPTPAPTQTSQPAYQQQPPPQPAQYNPVNTITSWGAGAISYVGSGITNISSGIQNFIQPVSTPIIGAAAFTPMPTALQPASNPVSNFTVSSSRPGFESSPYVGGYVPWVDPRTQTLWASEALARSEGYGKPVNLPGTIVMVGSQGTYTQGGQWVTSIQQFNAPGADYSGYRNLGIANFLYNTPSSDAGYARDWIGSYAGMLGRGNVPLSSGAMGIGNYGVRNDIWGADFGKVDMLQYNSTSLDAGGNIPQPFLAPVSDRLIGGKTVAGDINTINQQNSISFVGGVKPGEQYLGTSYGWGLGDIANIVTIPFFASGLVKGGFALYDFAASKLAAASITEVIGTGAPTAVNTISKILPESAIFPVSGAPTFTPVVKGGLAVIVGSALTTEILSTQLPKTSLPSSYTYRTDPMAKLFEAAPQFADVLYSGPSTLTMGVLPSWTPGADLLTRYGQNVNPINDTFSSNLASVEAQKPQFDQLGLHITATQTQLNQMLSGKINAQGQFTGTAAEYSAYKAALSDMNADVATYNKYGESIKGVIAEGYKTGAIIPSGNGGYQPNPDLARKYGAFSEWSADTTRWLRGGTTEAQIAAYEQSPAFKSGGLWNAWGEGSWKALTNPVGLANSALLGVEMYAGMGLASAGFTALAPVAVNGVTPAAATFVESIGVSGLRTMASPIFQYGTGVLFLGASVYSSTEGFTAPPERSMSNLGGMTIHLAAMTAGAFAPEGFARVGNYAAPQISEFTGSIGAKLGEIRQYGIKETIAQKIPTFDQIKYSYLEWQSPSSAISTPAASERFIQPSRATGDFTGSTNRFVTEMRINERAGTITSAGSSRGASVSGKPTLTQESLRLNYDPLAPLTEIQTTLLPREAVTTSGVYGKVSSGMRGSQLGRWDVKATGIDDLMSNLPLKERWKIREGGYAQTGSSGGYYGSGTPTGTLQSGMGIGGSTVRSGRQSLEIRSLSSGMEGPLQDLAPQQLEITPSQRTITRMRSEDLFYEYESRQLPPGMQRPALTESIPMKVPMAEQSSGLGITPVLWLSQSQSTTQIPTQTLSVMAVPKSDVASISTQAQEQRAGQIQIPALMSMLALASVPLSAQKFMQDQIQMPRQFQNQIPSQRSWQEILPVQQQSPVQTPVQTPRTFTPIIPDFVIPYIPKPAISVPPTYPKIEVPWKPVPPVPLVPWFPSFPSVPGSGPGPFQRKRKAAFTEIFNMGLDYSLRQRSKRQGKSWAQPKKVREARSSVAKKGAKKK